MKLSNQTNIDATSIDWKDTGTVVNNKYIPLARKKNRLQRIFDRSYLHGHMMRRGLYGPLPSHIKNDLDSETAKIYFKNEPKTWCQSCQMRALENQEHMLAVCNNENSIRIREQWLEKLQEHIKDKIPPLHEHIDDHLKINPSGAIKWKGSTTTARTIMSGCVPTTWRETIILEDHIAYQNLTREEREKKIDDYLNEYEKLLRWLGKNISKDIWAPIHKVRTKHYTRRGNDYDARQCNFGQDEDNTENDNN